MTYDLFLGHRSEARVLGAGLATFGGDVRDLFLTAVGEVAGISVVSHCGC